MIHNSSFSCTSHDDQEDNKVKLAIVFPSSQEELIADSCDTEEL
jgi:hypothetical protein